MNNGKRWSREEKRAVLAIVDGCMVFSHNDGGEWDEYPWIRVMLARVTARDLTWKSWLRHIRRWRAELGPIPLAPVECEHLFEYVKGSSTPSSTMLTFRCVKCHLEKKEEVR